VERDSAYFRQAQLLLRAIPYVAEERCFALKGGTAINLFHLPMPRLSVDIDLTYLSIEDRDTSLAEARAALERIVSSMVSASPNLNAQVEVKAADVLRAWVSARNARIKIELSPVFRGALAPPVEMEVHAQVQEALGYATMQVLQTPDLYGGKICAALDRQHPRDLFDVHLLLRDSGLTRDVFEAFLVYLISSSRPIAELLQPNWKDISDVFEEQFRGMTREPISLDALLEAREALRARIAQLITNDDKQFLLSVKQGDPEWDLLPIANVSELPAVRWKLQNIRRMPKDRHLAAIGKLERVLAHL
jgi:predicted nucleotidyltransferase component of viral defense system